MTMHILMAFISLQRLGKSLHIHSQFNSDYEILLSTIGHKSESNDWPKKPTQPHLSSSSTEKKGSAIKF